MPNRFFEQLSDAELLECDLIADDPEALEGLVRELPDGPDEPFIEMHYDFRKSDREKLVCVHGHHEHLCGYVVRKGDARYLVG